MLGLGFRFHEARPRKAKALNPRVAFVEQPIPDQEACRTRASRIMFPGFGFRALG